MIGESCTPNSRRELRRRDRRDTILDVAAQSFLERGYAGTTMSGIAATLGGSKGTLWSYFSSKEQLFAAVIDRITTAYRARLSEMLGDRGELLPTLRQVCTDIVEKVTSAEAVALHRLVLSEAARAPEMGRIFYDRAPLQTQKLLAEFLMGAMARGQIRHDDPLAVARLLVGLCLAGCHQKLLMGLIASATPDAIEGDVNRAVDVFMRAYALDG